MKRAFGVVTAFPVVTISGAALWAVAGGKGAECKDASSCVPPASEAGDSKAARTSAAGSNTCV